MEDPYQSMKIEKGVLYIDFQLFYGVGSWVITSTTYLFRYQDKDFVLIGAENKSFDRASQNYEDYSFNFLTKKWSLTSGNDGTKQKPKTDWYTLDLKELKTLTTLKQPYRWEVIKDVFYN